VTAEAVGRAASGAEATADLAARAGPAPRSGGGFKLALALARGRASARGLALGPPGGEGSRTLARLSLPLARRRLGADASAKALRERRDDADPGKPGSAERAPCERAQESILVDAPRRLLGAGALDRIALEVGHLADRPSLTVRLAAGAGVRLTRSPAGVEVVLEVAGARRREAEAELPALVAALRARGVALARAEVRTLGGAASGAAVALTGRRSSDTRAHRRQ
jgi:hypothetical protein